MTDKLEIMRVLVLSTAHLTAEEGRARGDDFPCPCAEWEHGFFCYVADYSEWGNAEEMEAAWPSLMACAKFAAQHKLDWVRFDCDADTVDGLEAYDW